MQCTNCEAHIPRGAGACPECGVFARMLPPHRKGNFALVVLMVVLALSAAAAIYLLTRPARLAPRPLPGRIHVVRDRPGGARRGEGATISEPEAILRLRRSLAAAPDCIAIMSKGYSDGGYLLEAINRCDGTRSGRWRVDGSSGAVRRATPQR